MILSLYCSQASFCDEAILKEFLDPQDSFTFKRISPTEAILGCSFQRNRFRVRALALAIPDDTTLTWRYLGGKSLADGKEIVHAASEEHDVASWVSVKRQWLSDVSMVTVQFPKVARNASTSSKPKQAVDKADANATILEATFGLTYSKPCKLPESTSSSTINKNPFIRIARLLVANPDEVNGAAGTFPKMEDPPAPPQVLIPDKPHCRIVVSQPGLVSIPVKDLSQTGFDSSLLDASYLTLAHLGQPYPYGILAADPKHLQGTDRIWFFCPSTGTAESGESTFYLGWGTSQGSRIEEATDQVSVESGKIKADHPIQKGVTREWDWKVTHIEQDDPTLYLEQDTLVSPVDILWKDLKREEDTLTTDFDLPDLMMVADVVAATASIQIRYMPPDAFQGEGALHAVFNELELEKNLPAGGGKEVRLEIPTNKLRPKGNRLTLSFKGKLPSLADQARGFSVDWIRVWYPGRWELANSTLVKINHYPYGNAGSDNLLDLARWNFPTTSGDWHFLRFENGAVPSVAITPVGKDEVSCLGPSSCWPGEWWLADVSQPNPPAKLELCKGDSVLRDVTSQTDLIVVTDPRFVPQLKDYLALPERQGITSRIVTTQQIYEEFSFGEKNREAIRDYCRYAITHYQKPRPQYLWLVGEARWDPTNKLGSHVEDLVPSPALQTRKVIHSNDQWYVYLVGNDALPDLLVSRVSVGTTSELEAYLDKVKEDMESREPGWWRTRSLLLTDDGFADEVETLLNHGFNKVCVPVHIRQEDFPLDPFRKFEAVGKIGKEARGIRDKVVKEWSDGARLVEYAGHGGITVWSHESLFKGLNRPDSDADRLMNKGKYSYVTIRSCMSASVNWPTFPGEVSVSEALIKAPGRGALAVLGSSGTEFATDQERFGAQFRAGIWNHHLDTLASIRAYAQCQFLLQTPELKGVVDQFLLHGDPTLSLNFPETLDSLTPEWITPHEGPGLRVNWSGGPSHGKGQVHVYCHRELVFESEPFDIPDATQSVLLPVPTALPFKPELVVALYLWDPESRQDAFRAAPVGNPKVPGNEWLNLYHSWVKPATGLDPEVAELVLSPTDPVVGEPVMLTLQVANTSGDVIKLLQAEARGGTSRNAMKRIDLEARKKGGMPWNLFPGEKRAFQWIQTPSDRATTMVFQVSLNIPGKAIIRYATATILAAPELNILDLHPRQSRDSHPVGEPLELLARVQNVGGRPTQALRLMFGEMRWEQTAMTDLPPIDPGDIHDATFTVLAPQSAFDWETRVDTLPKDQTSRTRWHRQSFRHEVPREITLSIEAESKVCSRVFETVKDLSPFTIRSLEPGERTLRVSNEAQFKDLPVMNLDILDTSEIRSATHAGAAAWQYQTGWWLSPFQLQAHPLWSGKPLKTRLPWDKPHSLIMISPTYYKHDNYQFVGYPMPALTLDSSECQFDLTPANTHEDGRFPPKLVEIKAPGLDWTLTNHHGAWPGFSGFRLSALPEILTPVIRLPEDSNWKPDFRAEWLAQVPGQATAEIRCRREGEEWSQWSPMNNETTVPGSMAQIRYWTIPDETLKGALIGPVAIRFEKMN